MIKLSYNDAINIQRAQLKWYQFNYKITKLIKQQTERCPEFIHPDEPISIFKINEMIPRGGSLEFYLNYKKNKFSKPDSDDIRLAVHSGIIRGLF